ncbi:MAG: hypothetical protein ACJA2S_001163 [Cyclobacteriaceae bacterium]|jgi:hypothetical protein
MLTISDLNQNLFLISQNFAIQNAQHWSTLLLNPKNSHIIDQKNLQNIQNF